MRSDNLLLFPGSCPQCRVGKLNIRKITFFTWVDGDLITVPSFPVWVCDVCGWQEHHNKALVWLDIVLNAPRKRTQKPGRTPGPFPSKTPPASG